MIGEHGKTSGVGLGLHQGSDRTTLFDQLQARQEVGLNPDTGMEQGMSAGDAGMGSGGGMGQSTDKTRQQGAGREAEVGHPSGQV